MSKKEIAKYARMASNEAHEEWMAEFNSYTRDLISEMIDKFDTIEAMANRKWYHKFLKG
jgi:secreted Zn-dependent insulinase-like peptidase